MFRPPPCSPPRPLRAFEYRLEPPASVSCRQTPPGKPAAAPKTAKSTADTAAAPAGFRTPHSAFTLTELVMAMAVTGVIALSLGSLAAAVHSSNGYVRGQAAMAQHARVALERIKRNVERAHANEHFPGFRVVATSVGSQQYPDVLVVWRPVGSAADPEGLPLVSELVVYAPNPDAPHELWEITSRGEHLPVPAGDQHAAWQALVAGLQQSNVAERVVLTDLVRRAKARSLDPAPRAVLRFEQRHRPSELQRNLYQSGDLAWEDLFWAQSIYSKQTGLRQSWCRIELHLMPPDSRAADGNDEVDLSVPFFGSAALYYELPR